MPNLLLKTCDLIVRRCTPILVHRSMCHANKPMQISTADTTRVIVNHAIRRCFQLNFDLEKSEDRENGNENGKKHIVSDKSKGRTKIYAYIRTQDSAVENVLTDEQLSYYFPAELTKRYKTILLEIEVMRQNGLDVPQKLLVKDALKLVTAPSKGYKEKLLRFLFINEIKSGLQVEKKEKKKEQYIRYIEKIHEEAPSGLMYGIGHNTLFLRVYNQVIRQYETARLMGALQFEPKLLIDCGFGEYMNNIEADNCVRQIVFSLSQNRQNTDPFDLQLCNLSRDSYIGNKLQQHVPQIFDPDFPFYVHSQSYIDLYDKNDVVYLTPHCKTTLRQYDPNKVYIIGGIVDKANPKPLSSAKAKKEGIPMMRLPLDEYVEWGPGSGKSLPINIMLSIMLSIKNDRCWETALKHIPPRKLKQYQLNREAKLKGESSIDLKDIRY